MMSVNGLIIFAGWLIAIIIYVVVTKTRPTNKLGIKGKLVWYDKNNRKKPFFNKKYKVFGKPDLIYKTLQGYLLVEFKSRKGGIFESDITQAKAAALAARYNGYKISDILIKTATEEKYITIPTLDSELHDDIESAIKIARLAKNGSALKALPYPRKCRACAFNHDCHYSVR